MIRMKRNIPFLNRRDIIWTLIVFGLLIAMWWELGVWYRNQVNQSLFSEVKYDCSVFGRYLSNEIHRRFALLEGLTAFVQTSVDRGIPIDDMAFDHFAKGLYHNARGIRNLSIAPKGIQRYVFPKNKNQRVIGHNLLTDKRPQVQKDVQRAIQTGKMILSGPYVLRQGGLGLVARRAVFQGDHFWGLTAMVIDLPPILDFFPVGEGRGKIDISVSSENGGLFFGEEKKDGYIAADVEIPLPDGKWTLHGTACQKWQRASTHRIRVFQLFTSIIVCLLTSVTYLMVGRQQRLKKEVAKRTATIKQVNKALEEDIAKRKKVEANLKESEKKLIKAKRLEAVGTLAGGVAHNFNNILSIILGNTELAMEDMAEKESTLLLLKDSKTAALRGRDVVRQLIRFNQEKIETKNQSLEMTIILREFITMLRTTLPQNIEIEAPISECPQRVWADSGQIQEILINLSTNALNAMKDMGGVLTIYLKAVQIPKDDRFSDTDLKDDCYIKISVIDTGEGIHSENLERIYDPYFTTWESNGANGLGLFMTHGIIKELNGEIIARSELGKGSRFDVYLPAMSECCEK